MLTPLTVEFAKLKRSLAALFALIPPSLIAVFLFANALRIGEAVPWEMWLTQSLAIWSFFMLPMSVTALTALVAHMEHGPESWDHLRALPVPRWRLYAAKAVAVLAVVAGMTVLTVAMAVGAALLATLVNPALAPTGDPDLTAFAWLTLRIYAAGLLMVVLQLWIALRFANFVPGLAVGIGGTFFAVIATSSRVGVFMPWQMPVNMLATEAWRWQTALAIGTFGGLIALAAMLVHLSRREVL